MDVPRELSWIGPLFVILYFFLWMNQSFYPLFIIIMNFMMFLSPFILLQLVLFIIGYQIRPTHKWAAIIFFLCYFCSGMVLEPLPYTGPWPPPPSASYLLIVMATPALFAMLSFSMIFWIPWLALLILTPFLVLTFLTSYTTVLLADGRIDAVKGILIYVVVIVCWTIFTIPFSGIINWHAFVTPMPLGPLVAINTIEYIPEPTEN